MEIKPNKEDLEKLIATGKQIIENASKDIVMWNAIKNQAEKDLKNAK